MHDHQTGNMARPTYHGSKDLRIEDHAGDKFILLAAPSANAKGMRTVSFLDGSVKLIDEADYQKQIAKQAKTKTPGQARGAELTPDFKQATKEFQFKANQASLLTRGTAHYLVIPVAIQSEDYIIKRVDLRSLAVDEGDRNLINLALVLEPSTKGNATTTPRGNPRTTQSVIVGINLDQICQIRYANPDGSFVDLMTVDPRKVPSMPTSAKDATINEQK